MLLLSSASAIVLPLLVVKFLHCKKQNLYNALANAVALVVGHCRLGLRFCALPFVWSVGTYHCLSF